MCLVDLFYQRTRLLPAPEAFGTLQSVAGARAGGHPVRVDVRVAPPLLYHGI
jgi:hypothetical protein